MARFRHVRPTKGYAVRIAVWNNLPSGGGQRALHDQVQGLLARGHDIELWSTDRADRTLIDLEALVPHHRVAVEPVQLPFSRYLPNPIHFYLKRRVRAMDAHCLEVAGQIHRGGFDVVLASTCQEFSASRLGRFLEIPSVLYLQEPSRPLFEDPERFAIRDRPHSLRGIKDALMDMIMVRRAGQSMRAEIDSAAAFDQILVNSRFSAESIQRSYGLSSRVCLLGVDAAVWTCLRSPTRSVVSIGTLHAHKRTALVLEALSLTSEPHPELHWIANGADTGYRSAMVELADTLGVTIVLHEQIPRAEMLEILGSAAMLVYAPVLEPFGYAPLECAAAGLTTVGVAQGGMRETVEHLRTGLLTQDDPEEMAAAIDLILGDDGFRVRLEEAAQRTVRERWTISQAAERLEHELERVVAQAR